MLQQPAINRSHCQQQLRHCRLLLLHMYIYIYNACAPNIYLKIYNINMYFFSKFLFQVNGEDVLGLRITDIAKLVQAKSGHVTLLLWSCGSDFQCDPEVYFAFLSSVWVRICTYICAWLRVRYVIYAKVYQNEWKHKSETRT